MAASSLSAHDERLIYGTMCLLGLGFLAAWNAVISAYDYFSLLFLADHPSMFYYIPVAFVYPQLLGMALMVRWGHHVSFRIRIITGFLVEALALATIPLAGEQLPKSASYPLTLACCVVLGAANSVLETSLFGFAGILHPSFTQAVMLGDGVAGVCISLLRVVTKLVFPADAQGTRASSMLFFAISGVTLLLCIVAYLRLCRVPYVRAALAAADASTSRLPSSPSATGSGGGGETYSPVTSRLRVADGTVTAYGSDTAYAATGAGTVGTGAAASAAPVLTSSVTTTPLLVSVSSGRGISSSSSSGPAWVASSSATASAQESDSASGPASSGSRRLRVAMATPVPQQQPAPSGYRSGYRSGSSGPLLLPASAYTAAAAATALGPPPLGQSQLAAPLYTVFATVWRLAAAVCAVFIVTFVCFPGLTDDIVYRGGALGTLIPVASPWFPILMVLLFNCCDCFGRWLPSRLLLFTPRTLWVPVALRLMFIPLLLLCVHPLVFGDRLALVFMAAFAASNGYCASLAMMYGPQLVPAADKERAGVIMSASLELGIFVGSQIALVMNLTHVT